MQTSSMADVVKQVNQLNSIRNKFGGSLASQKLELLNDIGCGLSKLTSKKALHLLYDSLLFLIAYPDNNNVFSTAKELLDHLQQRISSGEKIKLGLYNTGVNGSALCAAYSFEMVKWIRNTYPDDIRLVSFEADDTQIQAILSVVMCKAESEILQDANAAWKGWLKQSRLKSETLLDQFISIFDSSPIRPEVKDELWNTIGLNVEINFSTHCSLPDHLIMPYYHRALKRKGYLKEEAPAFRKVKITNQDAEKIIDCSRMILVRHLREIDTTTFTAPELVSYYHLPHGYSIVLMGMTRDRRHPIDSYMGWLVFKNGLPVSYAAVWILFDSARIGLNVFPSYRGGEAQYLFHQVIELHRRVYKLKRFTVDPYQLGKENYDGIRSGSFWVYYHAGFRPILKEQFELANEEAKKISKINGYRSPAEVLKKLADSRLQLVLEKSAVDFDATDLSIKWQHLLRNKYSNDRKKASAGAVEKLASILGLKNHKEEGTRFVLENWYLLLSDEKEWRKNTALKEELKELFRLKANGSEEKYIAAMQKAKHLKNYLEAL